MALTTNQEKYLRSYVQDLNQKSARADQIAFSSLMDLVLLAEDTANETVLVGHAATQKGEARQDIVDQIARGERAGQTWFPQLSGQILSQPVVITRVRRKLPDR